MRRTSPLHLCPELGTLQSATAPAGPLQSPTSATAGHGAELPASKPTRNPVAHRPTTVPEIAPSFPFHAGPWARLLRPPCRPLKAPNTLSQTIDGDEYDDDDDYDCVDGDDDDDDDANDDEDDYDDDDDVDGHDGDDED